MFRQLGFLPNLSIAPRSTNLPVMQPLVSILIPAHNAGRWVADALQSAVEQTWSQKEIILVDDGSTDATFAIAREFSSPIVKVIRQEKQGAAAARNHAFALSQG